MNLEVVRHPPHSQRSEKKPKATDIETINSKAENRI
jgi:hypothetical protein